METVAKPLQWMEDFTVSTNQLRAAAAARNITRLVVSEAAENNNNNDESYNNGVNVLSDDSLSELVINPGVPEVQNHGQSLFTGFEFTVATNNDEEEASIKLHKPNRKIKSRKQIKKPINLWELGKGTYTDNKTTAQDSLQSYYKILKNQKVPPPTPNDTVGNESSSPWPHCTDEPSHKKQPLNSRSSIVKLPPINNTGSYPASVVSRRRNAICGPLQPKAVAQPHKGNFLTFKPLTTSQRYNATSTLTVHRNKQAPRKPIKRDSFSGLEVAPTSGTALAYSKAMTSIKYENKEENALVKNGLIASKLNYPFRLSSKPPSPLSYRTGRKVAEVEKILAKVNPNISKQKDSPRDSLTDLTSDVMEDNQEFRQHHKRASIIDSFNKVSDEYLVRYDVDDNMKALVHKLRGGIANSLDNLTDEIRSDYDDFMTEIDQISYYNLRQAEALLSGYTPLSVVLISSTIPRTDLLCDACKPEVLSIVYDAASETYESLIEKIKGKLNEYRKGAKIKYLAIVCKGGPGYMYLLKKNPITPPKLLKDKDLLRFWRDLGSCMSKISNEPSVVHLMECNVAGNKQGEMLLQDLEATIFAHKVKIESPLEISARGNNMIKTYFVVKKFKDWKQNRYKE